MSQDATPSGPGLEKAIYDLLTLTDEPAVSAQEIAEELGVSVQSVYNYIDQVTERWDVQTKQIGNATAYYAEQLPSPSTERYAELMEDVSDVSLEEAREGYSENVMEMLCHDRADFLQAQSQLKKSVEQGGDNFFIRQHCLDALHEYLRSLTIDQSFDLTNYLTEQLDEFEDEGLSSQEATPTPPSGSSMSKEEMDVLLRETYMFHSDWYGPVTGVGGLFVYIEEQMKKVESIFEQHDKTDSGKQIRKQYDEMASETALKKELEELGPTSNDLLAAGDRLDNIIASVYGLRW